jgi:hypothetical protein
MMPLQATKAALEEGIVPGGGMQFYYMLEMELVISIVLVVKLFTMLVLNHLRKFYQMLVLNKKTFTMLC